MTHNEKSSFISHDGVGHHPLGAGSYYFRDDLVDWLCAQIQEDKVNIFIGAQPNSSPHMGNLCNVGTAFALGKLLQTAGKVVIVSFDAVDTAPAPLQEAKTQIDGITYQRSLRWTSAGEEYLHQFQEVLDQLSRLSGVPYQARKQADILGNCESMLAFRGIVAEEKELGRLFSRKNGCIGVRAACPVEGCGLADKEGIRNRYLEDSIQFYCPTHGEFFLSLYDPQHVSKLELNTPMRNLLRNRLFGADQTAHWIQVVGADYAGFYQEQLLWRPVSNNPPAKVPLIVYSPAILDWSGAKLSKSLYVRRSAYHYLRGTELEYMLSYDLLVASNFTLNHIFCVCYDWVNQPYKLFRAYSIYHLHDLLSAVAQEKVSTTMATT